MITFPEDLMPFHMQKYTMIHASNKHRARSHLMEPGSPTPELKASTLRLRKFSATLESQQRDNIMVSGGAPVAVCYQAVGCLTVWVVS